MERLVIIRTNPEQGKPVGVRFTNTPFNSGEPLEVYGEGEFPFSLWIQFEKLLKDGMEARARIETRETRRIEVEFRVPSEALAPGSFGGVSNLAREEDEAEEVDPVTPGAKRLIRSLRGEG